MFYYFLISTISLRWQLIHVNQTFGGSKTAKCLLQCTNGAAKHELCHRLKTSNRDRCFSVCLNITLYNAQYNTWKQSNIVLHVQAINITSLNSVSRQEFYLKVVL
jgi:hypothetical protein